MRLAPGLKTKAARKPFKPYVRNQISDMAFDGFAVALETAKRESHSEKVFFSFGARALVLDLGEAPMPSPDTFRLPMPQQGVVV